MTVSASYYSDLIDFSAVIGASHSASICDILYLSYLAKDVHVLLLREEIVQSTFVVILHLGGPILDRTRVMGDNLGC